MMAACPLPTELERLFLGGLGEKEAEALEQHVLVCSSCLENLKKVFSARETLAGMLSGATASSAVAASPLVAELIQQLKSMRRNAAASAIGRSAMIAISCAACQTFTVDGRHLVTRNANGTVYVLRLTELAQNQQLGASKGQ